MQGKSPIILVLLAFLLASNASAQDADPEASERAGEAFVRAEISPEGRLAAVGLRAFGVNLLHVMPAGDDLVVSPASISTAFALAYAGAKGETATQIARTLHYPAISGVEDALGSLARSMAIAANGRTLAVNNAIWLQSDLPVYADYLDRVNRNFGAGLQRVDYRGDSTVARLRINGWVESNTNNKIRNLLGPPDVTDATVSVLVNTIYFKADWAAPFDIAATKVEPFKHEGKSQVRLPLMHQQAHYRYAERDGVQAIALPYRGGETEMIVLLPKRNTLGKFVQSLTETTLSEWEELLETGTRRDVILTLPKFKLEKRYELKTLLEELGMRVPFLDESDFSRMKPVDLVSANPLDWNLKIEKVIHQVFVEVEEKGTEAAAATVIVQDVIVTGMRREPPPPPPVIFRADHPFLFFIRDRRTGAMLFIGRFTGGQAPTGPTRP